MHPSILINFFELKIFVIDHRTVADRPVDRDRQFARACSTMTLIQKKHDPKVT